MNTLYRNLVVERIRYAIETARAVAAVEHAGVKGAIREVLIADLFRPLLPSDIGVATGIVISSLGDAQSPQQDIVVFDRKVLPPLLFQEGPGFFPVESVLFTIEVKSKLTASELRLAEANARTLRHLGMLSGKRNDAGKWIDVLTDGPLPLVVALDTDLADAGQTEAKRYDALFGDGPPIVRGICVANRGWWCPSVKVIFDVPSGQYLTMDGGPYVSAWTEVKSDGRCSEFIELLAGILDVYDSVSLSRGRPPLSGYLRRTRPV